MRYSKVQDLTNSLLKQDFVKMIAGGDVHLQEILNSVFD